MGRGVETTRHAPFSLGGSVGLTEQMARDMAAILTTKEFGEQIIYTPYDAVNKCPGTSKAIIAIVDRSPMFKLGESQQSLVDEPQVLVSRADIPSVNRDGDTVTIAANFGAVAKTYTVRQIVAQDIASFTLKVI